MIRSVVVGCGSYLPERILTNADLAKMVDTTDEWIVERTGIRQRHIAADDEKTSDLALKAAQAANQEAGTGNQGNPADAARDGEVVDAEFAEAK